MVNISQRLGNCKAWCHKEKREVLLMPANDKYEPIRVTEDDEFVIWGIVTYCVKRV